jgi:hypothetical protein
MGSWPPTAAATHDTEWHELSSTLRVSRCAADSVGPAPSRSPLRNMRQMHDSSLYWACRLLQVVKEAVQHQHMLSLFVAATAAAAAELCRLCCSCTSPVCT